jgi:hypothetical protein
VEYTLPDTVESIAACFNTRDEMSDPSIIVPIWLIKWMEIHKITLWGAADLRGFSTPKNEAGQRFPYALSWVIPMNPEIMAGIQNGPNQAYVDEYSRVNNHINELSVALADELKIRGFCSKPLASSDRTDKVISKGTFPTKLLQQEQV